MSEFSQSYHLVADSSDDGTQLLRQAGLGGWVFPPGNGWVTVIPRDDEYGSPSRDLVSANSGKTFLWYLNAEDHGWMFHLFRGAEPASSYGCSWDEPTLDVEDESLDIDVLLGIVATQLPADSEEVRLALDRLLHPESLGHLRAYLEHTEGNNPGHGFAEIMGLEYFHWLSSDYMKREGGRYEGAGIVTVGAP